MPELLALRSVSVSRLCASQAFDEEQQQGYLTVKETDAEEGSFCYVVYYGVLSQNFLFLFNHSNSASCQDVLNLRFCRVQQRRADMTWPEWTTGVVQVSRRGAEALEVGGGAKWCRWLDAAGRKFSSAAADTEYQFAKDEELGGLLRRLPEAPKASPSRPWLGPKPALGHSTAASASASSEPGGEKRQPPVTPPRRSFVQQQQEQQPKPLAKVWPPPSAGAAAAAPAALSKSEASPTSGFRFPKPQPPKDASGMQPPPSKVAGPSAEANLPSSPALPPKDGPSLPPKNTPSLPPKDTPSLPPKDTPSLPPKDTPSLPPKDTPSLPPKDTPSLPPKDTRSLPPKDTPSLPPKNTPSLPPKNTPSLPPKDTPSLPPKNTPSLPPKDAPSLPPKSGPSLPPKDAPSLPPKGGPSLPPKDAPSLPPKSGPSLPPKDAPPLPAKVAPSLPPKNGPSLAPKDTAAALQHPDRMSLESDGSSGGSCGASAFGGGSGGVSESCLYERLSGPEPVDAMCSYYCQGYYTRKDIKHAKQLLRRVSGHGAYMLRGFGVAQAGQDRTLCIKYGSVYKFHIRMLEDGYQIWSESNDIVHPVHPSMEALIFYHHLHPVQVSQRIQHQLLLRLPYDSEPMGNSTTEALTACLWKLGSKELCAEVMKSADDGTYAVRIDEKGCVVLCVCHSSQIFKFRICVAEDEFGFAHLPAGPKFHSLEQLLLHYHTHPIVANTGGSGQEFETKLRLPFQLSPKCQKELDFQLLSPESMYYPGSVDSAMKKVAKLQRANFFVRRPSQGVGGNTIVVRDDCGAVQTFRIAEKDTDLTFRPQKIYMLEDKKQLVADRVEKIIQFLCIAEHFLSPEITRLVKSPA